jgi:hypothetical protein
LDFIRKNAKDYKYKHFFKDEETSKNAIKAIGDFNGNP